MKHDFSVHFLRVLPPDTNFGEAWESLCFALLQAETRDSGLTRLAPPDRGIDILHLSSHRATQCKSHEQGAGGSLPAEESVKSLRTAWAHRGQLGWTTYCLATNAHYTGNGFEKIVEAATALGLRREYLEHRGPEYWDELCVKHSARVRDRFYYRITADEQQVLDAFRAAGYYDQHVAEFREKICRAGFRLIITNNRTPVEISIPFSPELTVENCLDVAKTMLGVSLNWTNFGDLNTSARPSISITIGRKAQPFSKKIAELPISAGDSLELWITIVWEECQRRNAETIHSLRMLTSQDEDRAEVPHIRLSRAETTIARKEAIIEDMLWTGARQLISSGASTE